MLAHGEAGKDAQVAPGTSIPDSSVAGVVVAASANITGEENGIAINPDGSRIAVSIQGGWYNSGVSEVLLFNRHLDLLMRLPGSPDSFDEMQLSPDGTILRATASFMNYEQDLGLQSRLELARSRLQAWTQDDDRADFDAKDSAAHEENDWEKRKLILRKAVARYPSDPAILLRLANAEFATAKNIEDLNRAMRLYDQTNSVDPFDPMAHYARGKARAFLGDNRKAAEDFSAAIELPHILPLVQRVPGSLGINEGISGLSYQLNLQDKAELYQRRARARAATGDWQSVIEDVRWLREHKLMFPLSYELEALALDNLNDAPGAIASYEQAAATLKDAKSFGLEEFSNNMKESAWRNFKFASYKKRVADIYQRTGHSQGATTAYAAAQKLIDNGFASPDLSAPTRRNLEQLSRELAKGN
jgi:tetratricopeptide (TPR) repeat protein